MPSMTLAQVVDEPRTWEGKFGLNHSIKVTFDDGRQGEINTKPENSPKVIAALKELIGKPGEFVVEDAGQFSNGNPKPLRVKDYPGKAQPGGFGGGGPRGKSPQEQGQIARMSALKSAVEYWSTATGVDGVTEDDILSTAETFAAWIQAGDRSGSSQGETQGRTSNHSSTDTNPEPVQVSPDSSQPLPVRDQAETGGAGNHAGTPAPSPSSDKCSHPSWKPAPREGFVMCESCGKATKQEWATA